MKLVTEIFHSFSVVPQNNWGRIVRELAFGFCVAIHRETEHHTSLGMSQGVVTGQHSVVVVERRGFSHPDQVKVGPHPLQ